MTYQGVEPIRDYEYKTLLEEFAHNKFKNIRVDQVVYVVDRFNILQTKVRSLDSQYSPIVKLNSLENFTWSNVFFYFHDAKEYLESIIQKRLVAVWHSQPMDPDRYSEWLVK